MKKVINFMLLLFTIFLIIGFASAAAQKTIISGKIYNADYTNTISGANVTVTCNHLGSPQIKSTTSSVDGTYSVTYNSNECLAGDSLTVSATKGDLFGSNTGLIEEENSVDVPHELQLDLAIVNVPLVPEFGLIIGLTTILGAVGIFFYVRKK